MATDIAAPRQMVLADLKGKVDPDWCPGCGDFGVLAAVQKALVDLQIPNHRVCTISGIGCSSNFPGFINTYGMHTLHGRSLPVATGVKLANHELTVLVTGGDGDGFGIGADFAAVGLPGRRGAVTGRVRAFRRCIHGLWISDQDGTGNRPWVSSLWRGVRCSQALSSLRACGSASLVPQRLPRRNGVSDDQPQEDPV